MNSSSLQRPFWSLTSLLTAEINLTEYEYAFYSAVAENDSARELRQKDILRELAMVLTESIRQNVTMDWTIKEAARAKLRVIVKWLLKNMATHPIWHY
ncbi:hypothetical protein AVENLUH8758_02518 [Acinetobacter venetianus]|nr:hypothetical protein AVENLUH8758_03280 [Acinetobacter venetianus]KXZ62563.1 hypothetical protein AVENLUH8758_03221 [Acinetobacter venetianus]KXZ65828.1 hypothetical protein AVENLUH8758_02518 [Acinetobacter venetianus]